jgi:iodotyrosine deiodinase
MSIKYINNYPFITYSKEAYDIEEMESRSHKFLETMDSRRSVRDFSDKEIPESVIENILLTASTAPSGAHKQPWTFCVVKDPEIRKQIRIAAEKEERESYDHRMTEEWLKDLEPIGTDWNKPFLEIAPLPHCGLQKEL